MNDRKKNVVIRRYLHKVSRELPVPGKTKRALMQQIKQSVYEQTQEDASVDMASLSARFGTPRQIVESYMENMSVAEFLHDMRIRQRIVRIVFSAALAVVLVWVVVIGGIWLRHRSYDNGYYEDIVTVIERYEIEGDGE